MHEPPRLRVSRAPAPRPSGVARPPREARPRLLAAARRWRRGGRDAGATRCAASCARSATSVRSIRSGPSRSPSRSRRSGSCSMRHIVHLIFEAPLPESITHVTSLDPAVAQPSPVRALRARRRRPATCRSAASSSAGSPAIRSCRSARSGHREHGLRRADPVPRDAAAAFLARQPAGRRCSLGRRPRRRDHRHRLASSRRRRHS